MTTYVPYFCAYFCTSKKKLQSLPTDLTDQGDRRDNIQSNLPTRKPSTTEEPLLTYFMAFIGGTIAQLLFILGK